MSQDTIRGRQRGRERPEVFEGYKPSDIDLQRGAGRAIGGQFNLATMLGDVGRQQFSLAGPAYGRALGFYENLMGSRAAQLQSLAPALRSITEGGAGARSAIRRRLARSGGREMALAEETRGRQADINQLLAGAPFRGAEGVARLSGEGLQRVLGAGQLASGALGSAGALSLGALEQERIRKEQNRNRWARIGGAVAGIFGL